MPIEILRKFFRLKSAAGILLLLAAIAAIVVENSFLSDSYSKLLHSSISFKISNFAIDKDLHHWINDGLMAIFFLLVGLEIKRELIQGHLSTRQQFSLPAVAAIGGITVPAIIYISLNFGNDVTTNGWAIPTATDIAFALGVVTLLGDRVPISLKVTLVAIAIIDDLMAIIIIATFYTSDVSIYYLLLAAVATSVLFLLNKKQINKLSPYVILGILLWMFVLKSGIHASLAGVLLAQFIPLNSKDSSSHSPLQNLEHSIAPWVNFSILPIFAFANAGVSFSGMKLNLLWDPVTLGIILGLFFGKQIGVMLFTYVGSLLKVCKLPSDISWAQYYGLSLVTGIGFTMSLFIGSLAFTDPEYQTSVRLGVLIASLLAGILGYLTLRITTKSS
ncbi:MAG: Na+/H+ antiporter NhaA [Chloroflexi bacterium]|jgi:NhaA family Na+:H+ antiporter|nr:MAG: Na+/H+ antiporter NhaA [SAR202 cluster bacterium]KAA1297448.1 MAG: Na+/H+ antiporter NhaA [SAR202 cluster bacterium]MAX12010.1 Na+/H+ antiporter NhaA [Chloroflexota bacterium]|tara:strand:- start:740 stop:1906 length:1167 start_codon:yes stop_codon:yes gene_type:complete